MHHLFDVFGIEIEYMIIQTETRAVAPLTDRIMTAQCGQPENECRLGPCEVSNELAAHVFEIKTPQPTADLDQLENDFRETVRLTNALLAEHGCRLLPGPMHPTMDPARESHTWPHGRREIYDRYNAIFDCRGHGWFNLQSCHINLPFADDREFALLHSAVVLVLPLLPALAAGSPFRDGKPTGLADTRLDTYQHNQARCPAITGAVIPEAVFSEEEYRQTILEPMYAEIRPLDPDGLLQEEWLNSRGAIARFDRGAIEIRLLDSQECPLADLALADFFIQTIRFLVEERGGLLRKLVQTSPLDGKARQLREVIRHGLSAPVLLPELREAFSLSSDPATAADFWQAIASGPVGKGLSPRRRETVNTLLRSGNLADRLLAFYQANEGQAAFAPMMDRLSDCLATNQLFTPSST